MSAPAELGLPPSFAHLGGPPLQRQLPLTGPLQNKLSGIALSAKARGLAPGHASPLRTSVLPPPATSLRQMNHFGTVTVQAAIMAEVEIEGPCECGYKHLQQA